MKKDQLLLPENNECSVAQFRNLGSNEQPGPEGGYLVGGEVAGVADGLLHAAADQGVHELGEGPGEADDGEGGQAGAPGCQGSSQLENMDLKEELIVKKGGEAGSRLLKLHSTGNEFDHYYFALLI